MTSKEASTHYQPQGNSNPAHTAITPGELSARAPTMIPLALGTPSRKLVAQDGTTDDAAVDVLAAATNQISTTLTFCEPGTFRYKDVLWPETINGEVKKRIALVGAAISIVQFHSSSLKTACAAFFTGFFYVDVYDRSIADGK